MKRSWYTMLSGDSINDRWKIVRPLEEFGYKYADSYHRREQQQDSRIHNVQQTRSWAHLFFQYLSAQQHTYIVLIWSYKDELVLPYQL